MKLTSHLRSGFIFFDINGSAYAYKQNMMNVVIWQVFQQMLKLKKKG
jgi:hypothetical protein